MTRRLKIEVFIEGCGACRGAVSYAEQLALCSCDRDCDVIVWDVGQERNAAGCAERMRQYGILELPAIVIGGQLLGCCG